MQPPGVPAQPPLALIVALARNRVIGAGNRLPWRLPADLRRFRALTLGHTVIMGRRTWQSLPGALPERQNIVVTRQSGFAAPGAQVTASLDDALAQAALPSPVFCIGGGELYRIALPRASVVHATEIDAAFEGDVTFPPLDPAQWRETARERHAKSGPDDYDYAFVTYERRGPPAA